MAFGSGMVEFDRSKPGIQTLKYTRPSSSRQRLCVKHVHAGWNGYLRYCGRRWWCMWRGNRCAMETLIIESSNMNGAMNDKHDFICFNQLDGRIGND